MAIYMYIASIKMHVLYIATRLYGCDLTSDAR